MKTIVSIGPSIGGVGIMLAPELGGSGEDATIRIDMARSLAKMLVEAADQAERLTRRVRPQQVADARQAIAALRGARIGQAQAA